jgi:hypothetical protein
MSIHLAHVHGQSNIAILTADSRLTDLVTKCRTPIPPRTVQNLKLARAQNVAGKAFGPDIFPEPIHLGKCSPKPRLRVRLDLEPGLSRSVEFEMCTDTMTNHTRQRTGGTVAMPTLLVQTWVGGGFAARD